MFGFVVPIFDLEVLIQLTIVVLQQFSSKNMVNLSQP